MSAAWGWLRSFYPTSLRRSRALQIIAAAAPAAPCNFRAPVLRFGPKRSRDFSKTSSTNPRLPITAPSVKYLNRHLSIFDTERSLSTVSLSKLASNSSEVFVTLCPERVTLARPGFVPSAIPIIRRCRRATSGQSSALKPAPPCENQALTIPSRDFLPFPFFPPPIASP